jgi:hypothetical protein
MARARFIDGMPWLVCGGGEYEIQRSNQRCKQYCNSHQLFRIVVEWAVK